MITDNNWEKNLFDIIKRHKIKFLPYVPDAGHAKLISLSEEDQSIKPIVLSTEEEGVAFSGGCWLGGKKSVLLMRRRRSPPRRTRKWLWRRPRPPTARPWRS